ncbi:MAG: hypothetical protein R6U58_13965 [Bacteroidales bacterium]
MKRIFYLLAVIFFTSVVMSSCSAKKCPAYAIHETEQTEEKS